MTTLVAILMAAAPLLVVAGLLRVSDWMARCRVERLTRQIALTDAIHRELGAVAAPTLAGRPGRDLVVHLTLPFDRPAMIATILDITDRVVGARDGRERSKYRIVLRPEPAPAAAAPARRAARPRVAALAGRALATLR
jgi:hypothetical protein